MLIISADPSLSKSNSENLGSQFQTYLWSVTVTNQNLGWQDMVSFGPNLARFCFSSLEVKKRPLIKKI